MSVTLPGLNVIRSFEGRALRAYRDEVGVPTIGFGNTHFDKSITFPIVPGVTTITAEQAEALLVHSLETQYVPVVDRLLPGQHPSTLDAGYSFHYNTGGIARAGWVKSLMAGDLAAVQANIMVWNKAGGKALSGLTRRRAREYAMITRGDYGPEGRSGPTVIEATADGREVPTNRHAEALGLDCPVAPVPHPDAVPGQLKQGDTGPDVAALQAKLEAAGYPLNDPSGTFGPSTTAALALYQAHHGNLTADGRLGPASAAQLARETKFRTDGASKGKQAGGVGLLGSVTAFLKGVPAEYYYVGAACIVGALVLYFGWKHREELHRNFNQAIGRVVP